MALGTSATYAENISALTGLTHDIFVGKVVNNVRRESKVAMLFTDALPAGDYKLVGQNMKFATDLRLASGAMATDGKLPIHTGLDPTQGSITPVRRYRSIAVDNHAEARASGEGAFDDLADRIFDILWDSWKYMEIRHAIGSSAGVLCKVTSRTSSTVFVVEDGYNHDGMNPLLNLSEGMVIGWYDLTTSAAGGAAKITSTGIDYSTNTITVDSATTWETAVGNQIAAADLIYAATIPSTTDTQFTLERNLAPNGIGTILDPSAAATTVFGIAEGDYERWKPYRVASSTFDHLELQEFWLKLGQKRGIDVSPETDVAVAAPGPLAQLARGLMAYQQQAYTGGTLNGGYSGVRVGNMEFVPDGYFYHNVAATLYKPGLFRVNLGGDADFWGEDGSQWSRIAGFDGKEAFVRDYMQYFSPSRGCNGALTGITTPDVTDDDFLPIPNY
jgi:hypothetical protein